MYIYHIIILSYYIIYIIYIHYILYIYTHLYYIYNILYCIILCIGYSMSNDASLDMNHLRI